MSSASSTTFLRIRPSLPDPAEVSANRGPLMMETALSTLHSVGGKGGRVSLEIGMADGKIGLFARADSTAAALVESQIYGQYPDAEIEDANVTLFEPKEGEIVASLELFLSAPELFPIKRYPQFSDLVSRQNVDTIAAVTSTLVRYPKPGMRGHIQLEIEPVGGNYRKRALKFLPFLGKGLSKYSSSYAMTFTRVHLARGPKKWLLWPLNVLMGGWRIWFSAFTPKTSISLLTGEETVDRKSVV